MGTRIGIVTIVDDANFGNRLQNYALQQALLGFGCDPETIVNRPPRMPRHLLASRALHAVRADGPVAFARRNGKVLADRVTRRDVRASDPVAVARSAAIERFASDVLAQSPVPFSERPSDYWRNRYDAAVVGSDQVWNHGFRNAQEIDFLRFMPEGRRIAYAASFGVHDVPRFLAGRYREWLDGIPHLSVREQRGAEIVKGLTGRDVPVVVDPTLLLDPASWCDFARMPEGVDGEYAVQFFLGAASPDQRDYVRVRAQERGVRLLDLNDPGEPLVHDLDPRGFVGLLSGAAFVATDSFHAGVFSLLGRCPVVLRSRDETDSRLHTLFDLHAIERSAAGVDGVTTAFDPDWDAAEAAISRARARSWFFLRDALGTALDQEL